MDEGFDDFKVYIVDKLKEVGAENIIYEQNGEHEVKKRVTAEIGNTKFKIEHKEFKNGYVIAIEEEKSGLYIESSYTNAPYIIKSLAKLIEIAMKGNVERCQKTDIFIF